MNQTHAWFEVGVQLIDITHDQFRGTDVKGWVLLASNAWHAAFAEIERRAGFCAPSGWPSYPHDGYAAIVDELATIGRCG